MNRAACRARRRRRCRWRRRRACARPALARVVPPTDAYERQARSTRRCWKRCRSRWGLSPLLSRCAVIMIVRCEPPRTTVTRFCSSTLPRPGICAVKLSTWPKPASSNCSATPPAAPAASRAPGDRSGYRVRAPRQLPAIAAPKVDGSVGGGRVAGAHAERRQQQRQGDQQPRSAHEARIYRTLDRTATRWRARGGSACSSGRPAPASVGNGAAPLAFAQWRRPPPSCSSTTRNPSSCSPIRSSGTASRSCTRDEARRRSPASPRRTSTSSCST